MLRITEDNRSYRTLETDSGVVFVHYKSLRAFDKNLAYYNEKGYCQFCKGAFQFVQDDDFSLFVYYSDGSTYNGEEEVNSIRIGSISDACIGTPFGEEFYGSAWKITYNKDLECYFLREVGEDYEDETDVYVGGQLLQQ